jgi:hypothetical protein
MKNVWKGFVVGGLLGAAIGLVLDGGAKARTTVAEATAEADLAGRARELGHRVASSDVVHQAADRAHQVAEIAADKLPSSASA